MSSQNARPKKKLKSSDSSAEQKAWLEKVETTSTITMNETDPVALGMINAAAKTIPSIHSLEIHVGENMCSQVVKSVADILTRITSITSINFLGSTYSSYKGVKSAVGASHYNMLAEAIASSSSLYCVSVKKDLPWEMEAAIIMGLQHKTSYTSLELENSALIMRNPAIFAELLTKGKGLSSLQLDHSECHDIEGKRLEEGLQKCQSLTTLVIGKNDGATNIENTIKCLFQGLAGNQSLKNLELHRNHTPNPIGVSLLNTMVSNHTMLASIIITSDFFKDQDGFDGFCHSVSCSQSMTELKIYQGYARTWPNDSLISALSSMLQQSTSLEYLDIPWSYYGIGVDGLAVGIKACKTLTAVNFDSSARPDVTKTFTSAVICNPNITKINRFSDSMLGITPIQKQGAAKELQFYLSFNNRGRSLVNNEVPALSVWPYALKKAGSSWLPDALYFFCRGHPQLFGDLFPQIQQP